MKKRKYPEIEDTMIRGDEEINSVLAGQKNINTSGLLDLICKGYPVERLKKLFENHDEEIIGGVVYIAAELREKAKPLLHEVSGYLDYPNAYIHSGAIDVILSCASPDDDEIISRVILTLEDEDGEINWLVFVFLVRAPIELIHAGLNYLQRNNGDQRHVKGLSLLVDKSQHSIENFDHYWNDSDNLMKAYGVAAAARISIQLVNFSKRPIIQASKHKDIHLRKLAREFLDTFNPP